MLYFNFAVSCICIAAIVACVFLRNALPRSIAQLGNLEEKEARLAELKQEGITLLDTIDHAQFERLELEGELARLEGVHKAKSTELDQNLVRQVEFVFELGVPDIGETPYAFSVTRVRRGNPIGQQAIEDAAKQFWTRPHKVVSWARNRRIATQMAMAKFKANEGFEVDDYREPVVSAPEPPSRETVAA
jgi:hypothetical protein